MHQTVKCICGITISTCRCIGPKQIIIKKPCTHKKSHSIELAGLGEVIDDLVGDVIGNLFS
jgi:hypothetical protein